VFARLADLIQARELIAQTAGTDPASSVLALPLDFPTWKV
jgi:hypothetical protein